MFIPFTSLLTFPKDTAGSSSHSGTTRSTTDDKSRTTIVPPGSLLTCTTNHPAPAGFLPWHYARQYLQSGGNVVWLGCTASGEGHVRLMLRKSIQNGKRAGREDALIYIDAAEALLRTEAGPSKAGGDVRPSLWRLKHTVEQTLQRIRTNKEITVEEDAAAAAAAASPQQRDPSLVIIDDLSALAWSIEQMSDDSLPSDDQRSALGGDGDRSSGEAGSEDPRIKLLRNKRRQGKVAIHRDDIGERLGAFICDNLFAEACEPHEASLLVHLTADNTSIVAPQPRFTATRGGSYGVGTGFDADDAGEENEEEELYEEHSEQWLSKEQQDGEDTAKAGSAIAEGGADADGYLVAAPGIDWRVDSLLRRLLLRSDIWIEIRGLRSGKARDCHGEICIYGLVRPCLSRHMPLPNLPLPGDALLKLRAADRSANPLTQFNRLSLSSSAALASKASARSDDASPTRPALSSFKMDCLCEGRDAAMLFRVEQNGDAVSWSRGGSAHGTHTVPSA